MNDHTESLIADAFAAEAARAPDPAPVLAALARGRRRRRPALVVVIAAVAVAVTAVVVPQVVQRSAATSPPADERGPAPAVTEQNILLVGTDPRGWADTMMLAHLNADGSGAVLSLPRDSWVNVPGHGMKRLSSVDARFGTEALRATVEELTGVEVDHYAILPMASVGELADAVGGVPVCVRVATFDPVTRTSFPAGPHVLDGGNAETYLRQRQGLDDNELDRIVRAQAFLGGVARKFAVGEADLTALLETVATEARLDPGWDLLGAAAELAHVRPTEIAFGMIPFEDPFEAPDGTNSVFGIDPARVQTFVARAIGGEAPADPDPTEPDSGSVSKVIGCVD